MSTRMLDVLRQLEHADFRSGELIASRLGCSRSTVGNAIREAGELGVLIHAVHGRGYRLVQPLTWLDSEVLESTLAARGMRLHFHDQLESTNTSLLDWAREGAPHRALVVAEWQRGGRGRRGRSWLGGLGNGLAFSLLWRSARPVAELSGLSLAVGQILAQRLRSLGVEKAGVKWPNDILVEGAKLAGVLIELSGDMLGPSAAVIGVGINVIGGEALTPRVGQPVTDLSRYLGQVERNQLLLDLVESLDAGLSHFDAEGFAGFRHAWMACHAYQDQPVDVWLADGARLAGVARGVDGSGALLLDMAGDMRRLHAGEVSLRPAETP